MVRSKLMPEPIPVRLSLMCEVHHDDSEMKALPTILRNHTVPGYLMYKFFTDDDAAPNKAHNSVNTIHTERGDGVASIKQRRRDLQSDEVKDFVTALERSRLKEDLESSMWRRCHGFKATPSLRFSYKYKTDFRVLMRCESFSSTTIGDANLIRTLEDYSRPRLEGYRNTIELPEGNNVVPLRSDTIRLVQNRCSFHGLRSEDPNQHLKDFLKLMDSLDLDVANRERMRLHVPSTSDRHLIELKNQVQSLMEAYLAPKQPIQMNKITSSCEICIGPHDTQYSMENPEQSFIDYASSSTDKAGGALPSDMKTSNAQPKSTVRSTLSQYVPSNQTNLMWKSQKKNGEMSRAAPKASTPFNLRKDQRIDHSWILKTQLLLKKIGSSRNDEEKEVEWIDAEKPLDLNDTSKESIYESLIKEMPRCSLNYDFRIRKGDPRNLKIPCMIGHKFMANAYINVDLPMNIMSLAYYNTIQKDGSSIEEEMEVSFKTPYKDLERNELTSQGHDLLSSRIILSEDDYDRGCRRPSDLENGFYNGTLELGPEYQTGLKKGDNKSEMNDEGKVIFDEKKLGSS
ncbi:hypothetical protein Tco_0614087 [Tanacetum coccineum]